MSVNASITGCWMNVFGSGAALTSQQLLVQPNAFGVGGIGGLWGYARRSPYVSVRGVLRLKEELHGNPADQSIFLLGKG